MTTLTLQPGLRPAHLPPTLQPHAVLNLAPPTARGRSLAASALVYALLGGGLLWMARTGAVATITRPLPIGPTVLIDPAPMRQVAPQIRPAAVPRTTDVPALVPPPAMIPATPADLPTQDLSHEAPAVPPTGPVSSAADGTGTGNEPISLSGDAVRILHEVDPVYPPLAKAAHLQGQVVIRMTIDEQGLPSDVQAVSGVEALQAPALRAARQWRFEPARQNGQAVPATFLLTLNFVLR